MREDYWHLRRTAIRPCTCCHAVWHVCVLLTVLIHQRCAQAEIAALIAGGGATEGAVREAEQQGLTAREYTAEEVSAPYARAMYDLAPSCSFGLSLCTAT